MSRSAPSVTYEASYTLMRWRKPDPLQESGRFDAMDGQAAHITDCLTPSFGRDQSSRHEFAQCVGDLEQDEVGREKLSRVLGGEVPMTLSGSSPWRPGTRNSTTTEASTTKLVIPSGRDPHGSTPPRSAPPVEASGGAR